MTLSKRTQSRVQGLFFVLEPLPDCEAGFRVEVHFWVRSDDETELVSAPAERPSPPQMRRSLYGLPSPPDSEAWTSFPSKLDSDVVFRFKVPADCQRAC